MSDNSDLRLAMQRSIANYMHHELFEITGDTIMLPWLTEQADELCRMIDRAIKSTKDHPMAEEIKRMRK